MSDVAEQVGSQQLFIGRWLAWWFGVAVWTAGLLTTFPARVGEETLSPEVHFSTAKLLHISVYALFTALISWLPVRGGRWLLLAFLSLHGFATEFLQQWVELRTGSLRDVGIDHVGILLGLLLTWKWWRTRD